MKFLVLSNIAGSVDGVVDVVQQRHSVVAKESSMTNEAMARTAGEGLEKGQYDAVIVIAKDPIGAGMILNKQEGVEAAVCSSAEDVRMAKDNEANVIVIKDIGSDRLQDILDQIAGTDGVARRLKAGIRIPKAEPKAAQRARQPERETGEGQPEKKQRDRREEADGEPTEEEKKLASISGTRKGIAGKLKDALGIL